MGPLGGAMNRTMGPMGGANFMGQSFMMNQLLLQMLSMLLPLMMGRGAGQLQQGEQSPMGSTGGSSPLGNSGGSSPMGSPSGTSSAGSAPNLASNPAGAPRGVHQSRGTGYYPANNAMEGGFNDRRGNRLYTLQDYLAGRAPYVSVAMDKNMKIPYGTKLRIKELEQKYGRPIEFRVVDTGGAFTGRGTGRIDICTANAAASRDATINGPLTLDFG